MTRVRPRSPNIPKAQSLVEAASVDIAFVLSLPLTPQGAATVIRGIYESFRMLGEAILILQGIETIEHTLMIKALTDLSINSPRPLSVLDRLRRLRHDINYRGYRPGMIEVEDAVSIAKVLFGPTKQEVLSRIQCYKEGLKNCTHLHIQS